MMSEKKTQGSGEQQPQGQKFIIPMAQDPAKAAAEAAAKAALETALQAAANIQPQPDPQPDGTTQPKNRGAVRINTRKTTRRVTRNLQDAFAWLKSPGTLILGVASRWMVEDNAKARKAKKRKGETLRLRFARFENDPCIYFWVTHAKDGNGYDLDLVKGQSVANISDWLFEEGIAPPPGISQKFDLNEATEPELGGPVLCINTEQVRKVKHFDTSGAKDDEDEDE